MNCKHPKAQITERTEGYRPIVARNPNPVATGNITIIETCQKCGAVRLTNSNANQTETTGWINSEDAD
jgi:hypothetical protein